MARSYDIAVLAQKVEYLESAGIELPKVTSSDNGKVLQVVSGKWKKGSKMPDAVSANPEGEITNELTGLKIGDDKYKISPEIKSYTIEGETTNSGALAIPQEIDPGKIIGCVVVGNSNIFGFPRGDAYLTCFSWNNNAWVAHANSNVSMRVFYY